MKTLTLTSLLLAGILGSAPAAEPKRLLVVTVSTGFRHSSIELGEQVIRELAKKSGEFTVVSTSESTNYPLPRLPNMGGIPGLSREQQIAINELNFATAAPKQTLASARTAFATAVFTEKPDPTHLEAKLQATTSAELALAGIQANALDKLQSSPNKLNAEQLAAVVLSRTGGGRAGGRGAGGPRGGGGGGGTGGMEAVMQEYFAPDKLKNYDAMFFISTVGELPFPDKDAFFKWVADGHAVMGSHGASDSMHQTPEWAKMIGAEFQRHGQQTTGMMRNMDPSHPATAAWGPAIGVYEELYMFRPNYNRSLVHSLITMTEAPADGRADPGAAGWFPVAWTKMYGAGRVFFTSLGHREDVWDPAWTDGNGQRQNAPEVALAVQAHLLGGIRWALGLVEGDTKPQTQ